jgi:hypothetical protein
MSGRNKGKQDRAQKRMRERAQKDPGWQNPDARRACEFQGPQFVLGCTSFMFCHSGRTASGALFLHGGAWDR